jgi:ribonucleoside-diphosphate reductase alpha chain
MQHDAGRMAAQPIARDVLAEKYLRPGEFGRQCVRRRVARALAAVEPAAQREEWERRFLWAMENGFIPAGRVLAAAGTDLPSTWLNTFVQPVGDAIDGQCDGRPGIYAALAQATQTLALGGGIGYDFTPLRPTGAPVRGSAACAAGPVAFMEVFDRACRTVLGAGARRGAQMAVLRCDHPDIGRFVAAKAEGALTSFNLSVGLTDEFVRAVERDGTLTLTHAAQPAGGLGQRDRHGRWVYGRLPARGLWRQIMRAAYEHAEPGVLFLDRINAENNLGYLERIAATNSCAEQPLPDYGCSCLGSINLTALVRAPFSAAAAFDWPRLARLVDVAVRMLDNVLDATPWPLPAHRDEARAKRRIGLGFTGLGDALVMLGLRYDCAAGRSMAARIARRMRDCAYAASIARAREAGAFPAFEASRYLAEPAFAARLPRGLRAALARDGIRNSHLLCVAPTGTISLAFADNVSNGIEPAFAWRYTRRKRTPAGEWTVYSVEDYAWRLYRHLGGDPDKLPASFVTALQVPAQAHLDMMAAVSPYIDASVSKTVNVPADCPYAEFETLYMNAWRAGLKGLATFRPNAVTGAVLECATSPGPVRVEQTSGLFVA